MKIHEENHRVPFTAEQMFGLVVDVERYPEFLPGYLDASIRTRSGNTLYVAQKVGVGGICWRFGSVATVKRPETLVIRSTEPPFRHLEIHWRFAPLPTGCRVAFRLAYELDSKLLDAAIGPWFDSLAGWIVSAFLKESHRRFK